jgi:glycosyltransferase involved in cell wall biosynthesis
MKFYYIANEALDHTSAQAIHIDEICRGLTSHGHDVTLYAPRSDRFEAPNEYASSFFDVPDALATVFFQARLFFRLRRDASRGKPDVIYSRHALLLFMPALVAKLLRIPLVLEVNGPLLDESRRLDHSALARTLRRLGIYRRLEAYSVRRATRLVVVAPGIRDYLVRNHAVDPTRVSVIGNGVDTEAFRPLDARDTRLKLGLDPEAVYVGYTGSLNPWQGVRAMIEAAALVLADRPDVTFLIIGTGDELPGLQALAKTLGVSDAVQLLPPVSHDRVPEYVAAFDICLCYPTRFRENTTSPFKVFEYLACEKAVVLADLDGMRDAFGAVVAYAEPEAPAALAEQIKALVDDRAARERLGANGVAFIRAEHTWEKVAERLAAVAESARETRP